MTLMTTHNKCAFVYAEAGAMSLKGCAAAIQAWLVAGRGTAAETVTLDNDHVRVVAGDIEISVHEVRHDMARAAALFWSGHAEDEDIEDTCDAGGLFLVAVHALDSGVTDTNAVIRREVQALEAFAACLARRARPDAIAWQAAEHWVDARIFETGETSVQPRRPLPRTAKAARPARRDLKLARTPLSDTHMSTRHRAPCRTRRHVTQHETALREAMRAEGVLVELRQRQRKNHTERSLKAWTLTATCTIVAPPVGAALALSNLVAGASVRTAAHMLALGGVFTALSAEGAFAKVLQSLPI